MKNKMFLSVIVLWSSIFTYMSFTVSNYMNGATSTYIYSLSVAIANYARYRWWQIQKGVETARNAWDRAHRSTHKPISIVSIYILPYIYI